MPLVAAFAGKIGSGKTTITKSLADLLGWPRVGFGDYVRKVVSERGLKETREILQTVGTELLRADPRSFCRSVLANSEWKYGQNLLVDGLRHAETIEIIRETTQARAVRIVFVKISEEVRLHRLRGLEEIDPQYRMLVESHSSEAQVTSALADAADLVVDNDGPLQATVSAVATWVESLKS